MLLLMKLASWLDQKIDEPAKKKRERDFHRRLKVRKKEVAKKGGEAK